MSSNSPDFISRTLKQAGLRVTSPRLAVLCAVYEGDQHKDVDTITVSARNRIGSLSTQAVYDNLRVLADAGLVRCIVPAGAPALYESRVDDNHHHLICRTCGTVRDVDCAVGEKPCLQASETHGFIIDEAEVIYWGICPDCRARSKAQTCLKSSGS